MSRSPLRHLPTVARIVLGLGFFVFGLNYFIEFIPAPPPESMPASLQAFAGGLAATGYMFPLIKGTEVAAGLLLLANRFVPLALTILAPVLVNIVALHTFLTPPNAVALVLLALEIYLAWCYRGAFRPMLAARTAPHAPEITAPRAIPEQALA
jgi:uncharacterized membrane protein YphA (DoxX/SURF4 family)